MHVQRRAQKISSGIKDKIQRLQDVLHWKYAAETETAYQPTSGRSVQPGEQGENIQLICKTLCDTSTRSTN